MLSNCTTRICSNCFKSCLFLAGWISGGGYQEGKSFSIFLDNFGLLSTRVIVIAFLCFDHHLCMKSWYRRACLLCVSIHPLVVVREKEDWTMGEDWVELKGKDLQLKVRTLVTRKMMKVISLVFRTNFSLTRSWFFILLRTCRSWVTPKETKDAMSKMGMPSCWIWKDGNPMNHQQKC